MLICDRCPRCCRAIVGRPAWGMALQGGRHRLFLDIMYSEVHNDEMWTKAGCCNRGCCRPEVCKISTAAAEGGFRQVWDVPDHHCKSVRRCARNQICNLMTRYVEPCLNTSCGPRKYVASLTCQLICSSKLCNSVTRYGIDSVVSFSGIMG